MNYVNQEHNIKPGVKICKKCLLSEYDPIDIYKNVKRRLEMLTEDERVDDQEYYRRLELCKACEELNVGTCGACGCFVEIRAARKDMDCPHEKHFW